MKKIIVLLFLFVSTLTYGQIIFKTGDVSFDAELNITNQNAERDLQTFKSNLSLEFGVTTGKIDGLLRLMKPAEALLALRISFVTHRHIDVVVKCYEANKTKGWGYIAKQMGIKPGSPEFHALKGKGKNNGKSGNGNKKGNGHGKGKGNGKK